nr:probable leucine-rich repeat receptor-like protein kinase At5g63930 [Ipomoea batatas]
MISHLLLCIWLLLLFLGFCCVDYASANAELRALMEIKASLDPENRLLSSWTSGGDPCSGSFLGVVCNEHHKVGNISLPAMELTGKLSPALAELKCMSGLYLHYNKLNGEIPRELGNLTELTELYLDFNNLSGAIPPEIGRMASLQVMQLNHNQLTGSIPKEIGELAKLEYLALEHNILTGEIPGSLGDLQMLRKLYLGFNKLGGLIPGRLHFANKLEVLDVQNNTLSGPAPSGLIRRLNGGFNGSNTSLCGVRIPSLRNCTPWDYTKVPAEPFVVPPASIPQTASMLPGCNQTHCPSSSKFRKFGIIIGVVSGSVSLVVAGVFITFVYWRRKQKVGNTCDVSEASRVSTDQAKDLYRRSPSPLITLEYSERWDPMTPEKTFSSFCNEFLQELTFNLEEVDSATQHFSEANLLGKSNFSAVYRGILKDGSAVAIKSINVTACKSDEDEFMKGLNLIASLKHDNLAKLRGFCCSKGRGECILIYDFASKGNLSQYLDVEEGSSHVLNWPTRVSIIKGIAKGMEYLHSSDANKPSIVHRNISVEKILLSQQFNPVILDSGLVKLFAEDVVYSALKVSAALGYMAPEYITTGHFTEKSDVYAFGVIILQVLSGKCMLTTSTRVAAESCNLLGFIDPNLEGRFDESEATKLAKVAMACMNEVPENRPTMATVVEEFKEEPCDEQSFVFRIAQDEKCINGGSMKMFD